MITVTKIISALSGQLRTLGYPVKDVDITKNIPRPCLTVEAEHISCEAAASDYCGETATLTVYYFAERREKGYAELLKCHDDLQMIFRDSLKVTDGFFILPGETEYSINKSDMALIATFELQTVQELERDMDTELMEELIYENRKDDNKWP